MGGHQSLSFSNLSHASGDSDRYTEGKARLTLKQMLHRATRLGHEIAAHTVTVTTSLILVGPPGRKRK